MDRYSFRGKRLDNGEWVYGSYVPQYHSSKHGRRIDAIFESNEFTTFRHRIDPATVGQCTGAFDECGQSIYEGDIVEIADWGCVTYVKWHDGAWLLYFADSDEYLYDLDFQCNIIGNIHDNPELLTPQ